MAPEEVAELDRLRAENGELLVTLSRCRALITRWTVLEPGLTAEARYFREGLAAQLQRVLDCKGGV